MRRKTTFLAVAVGAGALVGCSQAEEATSPASTAPVATATPMTGSSVPGSSSTTFARPSSTTVVRSSTSSSTTSKPISTSTSSTVKASSTSTSTTAKATTPTSCGDIGFGGPGDDVASGITATGVGCNEAGNLVRATKAGHNFYSGPRAFTMNGFTCTVVTETTGLPVGHYTCTSGGQTITWSKT